MTTSLLHKPIVFLTRPAIDSMTRTLHSAGCDVRTWGGPYPIRKEDMMRETRGVDCIVSVWADPVPGDVIEHAGSSLQCVCTTSAGLDHIDVQACRAAGVRVGYTPHAVTDATANLAVGLLLAATRRFPEGVQAVKQGKSAWGVCETLMGICGGSLTGSTVGIVGLGRIGLAVAKRLQGFGISRILYTSRQPKSCTTELYIDTTFATFDELLQQSDFVIVTCALNDSTRNLFNKENFSKMKNTATFVNVSRGGVVVQDDLVQALRDGTISYAGLDVTTPEPLPADNALQTLPNCIVLPHIGWAETETRAHMCELTAKNALAALNGEDMPGEYKF